MQTSRIQIIPYKLYWLQYRLLWSRTVKGRLIFATRETTRTLHTVNCHRQTSLKNNRSPEQRSLMNTLDVLAGHAHFLCRKFAPVLVIKPGYSLGAYIQRLPSQVVRNPAYILCHLPNFICSALQPGSQRMPSREGWSHVRVVFCLCEFIVHQ